MNWAIEAFRSQFPDQIPHIITSNIEHCATELPLKAWQKEGKIEVDTYRSGTYSNFRFFGDNLGSDQFTSESF